MKINIFDYGMNGEGVGKIDGKIALVNNALIDEEVECEIVNDYGNYMEVKLTNILTSSKNREKPACPYFNECGGCQLQHMKYAEQLKFKTNHIKKTIKKITGLDVLVNPTIACNTTLGYRNKMSFAVKNSCVGLFKHNSNEIIEIDSCPLAVNEINSVLYLFKDYIHKHNIEFIKNLVVRSINNQTLIGIVTSKFKDLNDLFSTFSEHFNNFGLYEIINTRKDSVVLSGKVVHIGGLKQIEINDFGLKYSVDLMGFHQTNLDIQNKLYNAVVGLISPNDIVINGFSGQGLLSAILATKAKKVVGIEINESSHKSAEQLKKINNIKNMSNICGDFYKHFKTQMKNANTIILDPTKKGCGPKVMKEISGIENIIYISCNPIALSKDLNVIKNDYDIISITPFDMFPNTNQVETLVKLQKKTN